MKLSKIDSLTEVNWTVWSTIVEQTGQLFLTKPYVEAWVDHIMPEEHPGAKLAIFQIEEQGSVIGFLPFFEQITGISRTFKLLGTTEVTDYVDVLVVPEQYQLAAAALSELLHDQTFDTHFDLQCVLPSAAMLKISASLPLAQIEKRHQFINTCIDLPTLWAEYWPLLHSRHQKGYRHLLTTIGEEDDISYRCLSEPEAITKAIDTFITLHQQAGTDKAAFWTPGRETFFRQMSVEMAALGKIKLYFLDVNGDPAATLFVFDHNNEFQLYNSGFNAYRYGYMGVGNALILHTIRQAIELHKKGYSFLRGDEPYKLTFGAQTSEVWQLIISNNR